MLEQQIVEAPSLNAFKNGLQKLKRTKLDFFGHSNQRGLADQSTIGIKMSCFYWLTATNKRMMKIDGRGCLKCRWKRLLNRERGIRRTRKWRTQKRSKAVKCSTWKMTYLGTSQFTNNDTVWMKVTTNRNNGVWALYGSLVCGSFAWVVQTQLHRCRMAVLSVELQLRELCMFSCDISNNAGLIFLARDVIYTSRAYVAYDVSVRLSVRMSVTEVHWCIIANLGFKFRSHFTAHCDGGCAARHAACGRIISRHASQC